MKFQDFNIGDILLITHKSKSGYDTRIAQVSDINFRNNGLVTYNGYYSGMAFLESGSGAFDPQNVGKKPFGIIAVCIIDHKPTWNQTFQGPKPGNRSYDLMC